MLDSFSFRLISSRAFYNSSVFNVIKIINNEVNLNQYRKSKYILNQLLATTQPSLSIFYKFIRINKVFKKINDLFFYEKNHPYFTPSLGGIILYDYNIAQANKYGGLDKYIKIISESYSQHILFIDSNNNKKILIKIKPLILTDFDYPMIDNKKITYSRLTNGFDSVLKNKEDVIRKYNTAKINSFLGPNVDFDNIDSNYKSKIDSLLILSKKYSFIPCLKHFCYDYKKGNTHFSESINYKSYKKILSEDLKPYYYLSSVIDKSYLIMVGHHKIKEFDSINVASQSEKINLLISKLHINILLRLYYSILFIFKS